MNIKIEENYCLTCHSDKTTTARIKSTDNELTWMCRNCVLEALNRIDEHDNKTQELQHTSDRPIEL